MKILQGDKDETKEEKQKLVVAWFLGALMAYALLVVSYTGASFAYI